MPTLAQLGKLPTLLPDSLLQNSPLWKREVKTLRPLDLSLFVRMFKDTPDYVRAIKEVELIKAAAFEAHISNELADDCTDLLSYRAPHDLLTSGDLVEWLEATTLARRRALLFALEMNLAPKVVVELTWKNLRGMSLTSLAHELVKASPQHIRLPYVFWDTLPTGLAAPLFGLSETALEVSQGLGMATLQRLYDNLLMIDGIADVQSFELLT